MTGKTPTDLPVVTAEEASRRGWCTMQEAARRLEMRLNALYYYVAEEGFPAPVGLVPSNGPNPHRVREWAAVEEWVRPRLRNAAKWTDRAKKITQAKANGSPDVLSITALCDAAGLAPSTVWSYVRRTATTTRGPMAQLMRPAYRVGEVPYWSREQLDAYYRAKEQQAAQREEQLAGLPEVSQEQADERGWLGLRQLSTWSGFAVVTLHRMANEEGFPKPVAVIPSRGPNPHLVRDQAAVEKWLRARRPGWEPVGDQDARQQ